jgi:hypothetical protein
MRKIRFANEASEWSRASFGLMAALAVVTTALAIFSIGLFCASTDTFADTLSSLARP